MKKITVWYSKHDNGISKLNHIEDGWSDSDYPQPIKKEFKNQEAWKNMKWERKHAHLVNDIVVYIS